MRLVSYSLLTAIGIFGLAACSDIGATEDEARAVPYAEGSAEAVAILGVANDQELDLEVFDDTIGLDARAAKNIIKHRDGEDPDSSADDNRFDNLAELYGVSYCKKSCLDRILDYAKANGYYNGNESIQVVFSPQPAESTHLTKIADYIDTAEESIDIAMYSYSHGGAVRTALKSAMDRGVKIRFLANSDLANSASKGGGLEEMGIDVRRVTKIMHHKFAIIDGPRDDDSLDKASTAKIVTGSGNWSSSAGTLYDENTLFLDGGYTEIALRMQRDFDTLWAGSKDVVYEDFTWDQTRANITDDLIADNDDPNTHVLLTSYNFKSNGNGGWSTLDSQVVADGLSDAILGAQSSIKIASGHFVSIPISEALVAALEANPSLDVQIALDCQETSKGGVYRDLKDRIEELGGTITYKCNTYRWHYKYAKQMHHKYMIIDDTTLYTGSYNMSKNAEKNTFENMVMLSGPEHADLIAQYIENQAKMQSYGAEDGGQALTDLREEIESGDAVPLSWQTPISMSLDEFQSLKNLIRDACPATKSWENTGAAKTYNKYFNKQPQWFAYCQKDGYPWPSVPSNLRVQ